MGELTEQAIGLLIEAARQASANAYCPYSKFPVGAAVLADDGQIDAVCNVENASYGLTLCAERNAVFRMAARGGRKLVAVAVYTPTPTPTAPCGACRQVIHEFGPDAWVLGACAGPDVLRARLVDLLPGAFGPADLT